MWIVIFVFLVWLIIFSACVTTLVLFIKDGDNISDDT